MSLPKPRRLSILDLGGVNSVNNFAQSYARAQSYTGAALLEPPIDNSPWFDDLSPNSSPRLIPRLGDDDEEAVDDSPRTNIHSFEFPQNEYTNLLPGRSPLTNPVDSAPMRRSSSARSGVFGTGGSSTVPQTVFNSINTLMGMAMLTLPFGFKLSGWVIGSILLAVSYAFTNYTAICLGSILRKNPHLNSYGDIAHHYGGLAFLVAVTAIFTIDLFGACMSLIVIFSDLFGILFPEIHIYVFKTITMSCVFLLTLLPLSVLSLFSLIAILSTVSVMIIIIVCGFVSLTTPGSLLVPAATNMWPENVSNVFLSLGIFMAPWGGHPVFPELYRDMRHPKKYPVAAKISFGITFGMDYLIGTLGFIMFGINCDDSIIKTLMTNPEYPTWVKPVLSVLMGSLSLAKLPLITKPLISVYESLLQFNFKQATPVQVANRVFARAIFCFVLLGASLLFNSFGKLVSFLGSSICYTICLTLPFLFYEKAFREDLLYYHRTALKTGAVITVILAILGTYSSVTMDI